MIQDILHQFVAVVMKSTIFWDVMLCFLVDFIDISEDCTQIACCLLCLFFCPDDRDSMFLRNIGKCLPGYIASHSGRWYLSRNLKLQQSSHMWHCVVWWINTNVLEDHAASQGTRRTQGITLNSHLEGSEFDLLSDLYTDSPHPVRNWSLHFYHR
jgi:hypothetical protein